MPCCHIAKLAAGVECPDRFMASLERFARSRPLMTHQTRNAPKREQDILSGGSLYWVVKGRFCVRQRIVRIERQEGWCEIVVETRPIRVAPSPKSAFQGWRYLAPADAPADMGGNIGEDIAEVGAASDGVVGAEHMPQGLAQALRDMGVL